MRGGGGRVTLWFSGKGGGVEERTLRNDSEGCVRRESVRRVDYRADLKVSSFYVGWLGFILLAVDGRL